MRSVTMLHMHNIFYIWIFDLHFAWHKSMQFTNNHNNILIYAIHKWYVIIQEPLLLFGKYSAVSLVGFSFTHHHSLKWICISIYAFKLHEKFALKSANTHRAQNNQLWLLLLLLFSFVEKFSFNMFMFDDGQHGNRQMPAVIYEYISEIRVVRDGYSHSCPTSNYYYYHQHRAASSLSSFVV